MKKGCTKNVLHASGAFPRNHEVGVPKRHLILLLQFESPSDDRWVQEVRFNPLLQKRRSSDIENMKVGNVLVRRDQPFNEREAINRVFTNFHLRESLGCATSSICLKYL